MFKMEFMVLYLAEIAMFVIFISAAYFLVLLSLHFINWIGRIFEKGGKKHGKRK